jgi:hypothetical protein
LPLTTMEQECINGSILDKTLSMFDSDISKGYGAYAVPTSGTPMCSSTR